MIKYPCPVCNKRACDSEKELHLSKLTNANAEKADVIIKCQNCKNTLAVEVATNTIVENINSNKNTDL